MSTRGTACDSPPVWSERTVPRVTPNACGGGAPGGGGEAPPPAPGPRRRGGAGRPPVGGLRGPRQAAVVALELEEQVQAVGPDVALVVAVVAGRRDAVGRRPAFARRARRRQSRFVGVARLDSRARIGAGPVVEAGIVAVVGLC